MNRMIAELGLYEFSDDEEDEDDDDVDELADEDEVGVDGTKPKKLQIKALKSLNSRQMAK